MELAAAVWSPFDIPSSNWTMEYEGWAPGYPAESESAETFGSSWLQTSSRRQMVQYAAATDYDSIDKAAQDFETCFRKKGMKIPISPIHVFEDTAREFKDDINMRKMKIHKYPSSIQIFDDNEFTVPRLVAIGPYHHGQGELKRAEKAKQVAAYHCIVESGQSVRDIYDAVVCAAHDARGLYDMDATPDISENDFFSMMFYYACFLVQYFVCSTEDANASTMDPSLRGFFDFNRKAIRHDIVLLENQIPWCVVEAVLRFRPVDLRAFVAVWRKCLQDRKVLRERPFVLDASFEPPHLLGLLRFYIVGRGDARPPCREKTNTFSVSAIELAENGIRLKANEETTELIHMGFDMRGIFFAELSMAPLSLDDERASFLINMAALELCTTSNFMEARPEDSAVCSYLLLLSLLVHREEDVQELRTKHLLQGGAGLINKDALTFFTKLQSLPLRGSNCYVRIMMDIERYKETRQVLIRVHSFFYKNKRTILDIFSVLGVLVSILGTLMSLKKRLD